jgi:N-methylhydantoinase A/oxoprolinase/acetone carboxylase beta subunit
VLLSDRVGRAAAAHRALPRAREPRRAFWEAAGGFVETPVFALEELGPGDTVTGPALLDGAHTTCVIEPGWRFSIDGFGSGVLERL